MESIDDGIVRFACGLALPANKVADLFVLSYAQTYASCQGTEFDGTLRLHDTSHKFFTPRHLFVGLSRAKSCFAVDVAGEKVNPRSREN